MLEETGDIFNKDCDAVAITTNGYVKRNGEAVMGMGIAAKIKKLVPGIDAVLGSAIMGKGNHVHVLKYIDGTYIVSFPVKASAVVSNGTNAVSHAQKQYPIGKQIPGFHAKADLKIIERSAHELVSAINGLKLNRVLVPRPGCGAGELSWEDVKPVIQDILDDRFVVCTF